MFFHPEFSHRSILLIAGDVSGDVHTAALGRRLLDHDPSRALHALGGKRLRKIVTQSAGGTFIGDTTHCSAIGISSAARIYLRCRRLGDELRKFLRTQHVDLAILCDWGAFNGRALRELHALGIPTLYYFPPCSWKRKGSRGLGIVPYVTRVATPFSWSAERLRRAGAQAEWVGHPCLENLPASSERPALRLKFGIEPNDTLVALFPGSRRSELRVLGPRMAEAAAIVNATSAVHFIAAVPRELEKEAHCRLPSHIRIVTDCASELLAAADAAVVKTGTATLEAVLANTPQVTVYDVPVVGRIEWCLLWAWRRIPFIAMPNIILERQAVPELIGLHCRPAKIAGALMEILKNGETRSRMLRDYATIQRELGSELAITPSERTAQIVEEMLRESIVETERETVAA